MSAITAERVKELREKTNAGMMECKKALADAKGDLAEAEKVLIKRGVKRAEKKKGRVAQEGIIYSYVHLGGKIGVLLELNCETDFVSRNQVFQTLAKEIAMQIAATNPRYVMREDVSEDKVKELTDVWLNDFRDKPKEVAQKIIAGKLDKYFAQECLMEQPFIKDDTISINDYIKTKIAEIGENIVVRRFVRYELGAA